MAELMLVNPGRRVKKRKKGKRVKRAKGRRKMSALQLKYFGKKSLRKTTMARKKRRTKRRNPIATLAANPKRRRRLSSHRKTRRVRRRNPIGLGRFNVNTFLRGTLMPSAIGAAGALGLDLALSYIPIPDALRTPMMKPVVRIAGAVALGMLAGAVTNRRTAEQMTAGAVTVIMYDTLKGFMQTAMPTVALSGMDDEYPQMGYAGAGMTVGGYVDSNVGGYVDSGMGVYSGDMNKVSSL